MIRIGIINLLIIIFLGAVFTSHAQEKASLKIDLAYHRQNNSMPVIKAIAKSKIGKKYLPVEGVEINVFFMEESAQGFIGRLKTNNKGTIKVPLPERFKAAFDSSSNFIFIATVTDNELYEDQSAEMEITKARIELVLLEEDSIKTIGAKLLALDSIWVAVPETDVKLVVKRLQSDLNASEEEFYTSDEMGEVSAEFNLSIAGDTSGNLILGAKIEDHEMYGNIETVSSINWGIRAVKDHTFSERSLWATRDKTPLWLLIVPNLMILSVWGVIAYLIFQMMLIIRIGRDT